MGLVMGGGLLTVDGTTNLLTGLRSILTMIEII